MKSTHPWAIGGSIRYSVRETMPADLKVLAIGKRGVISSRLRGPVGAVLIPFSGGGPAVAR